MTYFNLQAQSITRLLFAYNIRSFILFIDRSKVDIIVLHSCIHIEPEHLRDVFG